MSRRAQTLGEAFEQAVEQAKPLIRKHNPEYILKDGSLLPSVRAEVALNFVDDMAAARIVRPNRFCEKCPMYKICYGDRSVILKEADDD